MSQGNSPSLAYREMGTARVGVSSDPLASHSTPPAMRAAEFAQDDILQRDEQPTATA